MKHSQMLKLTYTAMLTAIVCIATMFFQIPTIAGYTNLGDGFVLLGALFLGPVYGAVAGGTGSMLADLLTGYAYYAPGTLLIKGGMALIAGLICSRGAERIGVGRRGIASLAAEAWMVLGYWFYALIILKRPDAALVSIPNNIAQGVVGIAIGMILYYSLSKIPIWKKVQKHV